MQRWQSLAEWAEEHYWKMLRWKLQPWTLGLKSSRDK
jgi:hypothetical protein